MALNLPALNLPEIFVEKKNLLYFCRIYSQTDANKKGEMAKHPIVERLEEKVSLLIEQNVRLEGECASLNAQNDKLRNENRRLQEQIAELQRRVALAELGGGMTSDGKDVKRARQQINRLVREIDRCIALMNR